MKYLFFICTISIVSSLKLSAQETDVVFIQKEKRTPPGTLFLQGNRFLDKSEISNISWLEFLHYAKKDSSNAYYESMLPDTTVWKYFEAPGLVSKNHSVDSTSDQNDFTDHYLRYPGYRYLPVVGISYYQASEYCRWRSAAVNIAVNKLLTDEKKSYRIRYKYSLASAADLAYASRAFSGKHRMDRKTANWVKSVAPDFDSKKEFWHACVRQPVALTFSGKQVYVQGFNFIGYVYDNRNQWNFHNVLGNVSEMTDEEGKTFGGAWIHEMDEIMRHKIFMYTKPEYWIGFRCVATVEIIRQ